MVPPWRIILVGQVVSNPYLQTIYAIWKGSGPTLPTQSLGDLRSPWLLTTYYPPN